MLTAGSIATGRLARHSARTITASRGPRVSRVDLGGLILTPASAAPTSACVRTPMATSLRRRAEATIVA